MKKLMLLASVVVYFSLTACGQTGPLYLPKPKPKQNSTKASSNKHETDIQKNASTGQ